LLEDPLAEEVLRGSFLAALAYRDEWQAYRAAADRATRVPPRRDLRMEALLEILDGTLRVNAHSYLADEILMLMGVADDFGFKVAVLQHVLEGYKVADEIAAHGAAASTFSDWWAYKYEVIDAIPYNGVILHDRGVSVSYDSDSDELGRRLPLEAAKAIRYGDLEPAVALSFVTSEPAKQLGVGDRIGTLETGKDGDFVIWSGDPLSTFTRCEQTWIDGRRYFDREQDLAARPALEAERLALIAKVRAESKKDAPDAEADASPEESMDASEPVPPDTRPPDTVPPATAPTGDSLTPETASPPTSRPPAGAPATATGSRS
ncbi:MAG: amidohydrolase family protein, partial [Acidobacteria bacterium]|nr:amidohydrolase family protein [Acidobacteriota bacterium]